MITLEKAVCGAVPACLDNYAVHVLHISYRLMDVQYVHDLNHFCIACGNIHVCLHKNFSNVFANMMQK